MIICSPQLGLSPESNLGGEVYDREMIRALDGLGVKTLIILPLGKKYPPLKHARIYFLPIPIIYPPWLFNLLILPYLFFLQWKYKFDVLRVHSPYFVGPAAVLFNLFHPEIKTIVSYLHLEPDNNLYSFADKQLFNRYSLIITISGATKNDIIGKYKVDPHKIKIIPCGVDEKFKPVPKKPELIEKYQLANKKILLYVGQLIERKNIPFLFNVIKRLPTNYVLMICGEGPVRSKLEKLAPPNVIFTGLIPENDKVDYYNLADVFVCPSKKEGFGLSVAEAIACGKPVVASNTPIVAHTPLHLDRWVEKIKNPVLVPTAKYSWEQAARRCLEAVL